MLSAAELAECRPHALDLAGRAHWRVRLVAELVEINAMHLRAETRRAGADIELQGALEQGSLLRGAGAVTELRQALSAAEAQLDALEQQREELLAMLDAVNAAEAGGRLS
ncbi:hypothetical protein GPA19_10860 [Azoarcus indigens]|uniref:Uncharacterized protein n=1 Tax=Azoarcus indigens TaxID=29545 RepID=A0A4R6E6B1_9RHOO|nr:hypothetical protein [Azoarcus indigens]NMG65449.1 hypothetical protein [Azoarcus indigens]TDN53421.1 hypothetical protein C7389_10594 [Azoarcus indigens]